MAKINGVFEITGESAIEVNGERYELIEGPAKKGDIAKIVKPWASIVKGAFYPVINEDHIFFNEDDEDNDDFVFIDGETCHASAYREKALVFRKVAEFKVGDKVRVNVEGTPEYSWGAVSNGEEGVVRRIDYDGSLFVNFPSQTGWHGLASEFELVEVKPELKTEKRHAKVGERILIVDALNVGEQTYKEGDILTVTAEHDLYDGDVFVAEQPRLIISDEYEVVVEEEKSPKVAELPTYKTEKRPAKIGDRILIVDSSANILGQSYEEGDVLRVIKLATDLEEGDVYVEGERHFIDYSEYEVIVEDEKAPVKVGDIAKVTGNWSGEGRTQPHGFEIGEIVEVTRPAFSSDGPSLRCTSVTSGIDWAVSVDHLEKAEEEGEETTIKFEVGDIVVNDSSLGKWVGEVVRGPYGPMGGGSYDVDTGESIRTGLGDYLILIVKKADRKDK